MTGPLPLAPHAVAEWMPFWKAAGFFFATFVLEDVAAVSAGLLLANGSISWPVASPPVFPASGSVTPEARINSAHLAGNPAAESA